MQYTDVIEYFSSKKGLKNLENIMPSETSQTKERIMWFHLQEIFRTEKSIRDRKIKHCQGVEGMEKGGLDC